MKTVVISGYYGYDNIGDEALLASIISALKSELPDLRIVVLSAQPGQTRSRYGVEAVSRLNPISIITALSKADLFISGGGSLLQDVTGPLTIPYYLGIAAVAGLLGKPVMFYAQGIGPVNRPFGRMLVRLIANRVDMITLRDPASADLLREIGVTQPPVEITADPVFGTELDITADPYAALGITPPGKPVAGIFIREWPGPAGWKKAVAGMADSMYDRGWEAVFVPMQYPGDNAPAKEIAGMMKNKPHLIEQGLNFMQAVGLVSSMKIVVGMRLHALIIAAVAGVPMVGLSYDPKVSEFLASIGQPVVEDLASVTSLRLVGEIEEVIANLDNIRQKLLTDKTALRRKALRNSQIAADLLTGKTK